MNKYINVTNALWSTMEMLDEKHRSSSFEELPERECVLAWIPDCFYDEETELEEQGIFTPVSYFYPDSFDYTVEELPENQDIVGFVPDQDEGIA